MDFECIKIPFFFYCYDHKSSPLVMASPMIFHWVCSIQALFLCVCVHTHVYIHVCLCSYYITTGVILMPVFKPYTYVRINI